MKRAILLILLLLMVYHSQAQFAKIGLKAGSAYANNKVVGVNNEDSYTMYRPSYQFGVVNELYFNDRFSQRIEFLIASKGSKFSGTPNSILVGSGTTHLTYLNLPVLFGYQISSKFQLLAGTELGDILSAKSYYETITVDEKEIWDQKLDIALVTAFNYKLFEKVNLDFRYVHGIVSFTKGDQIMQQGQLQNIYLRNRAVQLSVDYIFFKKEKEH